MSSHWPDTPPGFAVAADLIFDSWVLGHGPTEYVRDYDLVVATPAAKPDGSGSYIAGHYRVRFSHSPIQRCETVLEAETWRSAWRDPFTNFDSWRAAGEPAGFVWAQGADAYPGPSLIEGSDLAKEWGERLGHDMFELKLETNAYTLWLLFHDLDVVQIARGDAESGTLKVL